MYNVIESKQHGMNFISILQLKGHGCYYVQLNKRILHKTFNSVEGARQHINTYMPTTTQY